MFQRKNEVTTNTIPTLSADRLTGELERVIEKGKPKQNLVLDEDTVFTLPKLLRIRDNDDFEQKQEIKNNKIKK